MDELVVSADGWWKVVVKTPMGGNEADFDLSVVGNDLQGIVHGVLESSDVRDGRVEGHTLRWTSEITRPLPLVLKFTATVDGDAISGDIRGPFFSVSFAGFRD